ncbi:MAG: hypothetical protein GY797_40400, partial [Deltaproteobacteria bacterium]|nr:hypothetical protein [Deltaproteobacteria bacterium]
DGSENFNKSGIIQFVGSKDFAKCSAFGKDYFWIRAKLTEGAFTFLPQLTGAVLNTVWASNEITFTEEIIGSSTGLKSQKFTFRKKPVLQGQRVLILETEFPLAEDEHKIQTEEGSEAIQSLKNSLTGKEEIWVRWHEVTDFYNSTARSRHYILDHANGIIQFGDGIHGMIPSQGRNSIKAVFYRAGGGSSGNQKAGEVSQLKSSLASIDKIYNFIASEGGSELASDKETKQLGPQIIRSRDRSVSYEDFEAHTLKASAKIARVGCLPNIDPNGFFKPGWVTIVVVPKSRELKPLPSLRLLKIIKEYLDNVRPAATMIHIKGPEYLSLSVQTSVKPLKIDQGGEVRKRILKNLQDFFHPLTGGPLAKGW